MLVTLLHNKPLLNEPGIKETHSSFKPYNKIITYKNLEIAILRNVKKKNKYNDIIQGLLIYHKKHIQENKDKILEYISSLKNKKEFKNGPVEQKTSIYGMKIVVDYEKLYNDFINYFNNNSK